MDSSVKTKTLGLRSEAVTSKVSETSDPVEASSLFLGLMGSPFDTDWTTTVFRLLDTLLKHRKNVCVWCCGFSTMITQTTATRPPDPIHPHAWDRDKVYSMSEMAQALLHRHPEQLRWCVCRYCMEERGATAQIPEVEILLPFSFNSYLNQADQSLVLGIK